MDIKVGSYIKLREEYQDRWPGYSVNPALFPMKVTDISSCRTKPISEFLVCRTCPGHINGACWGRGEHKLIVELVNTDWDE